MTAIIELLAALQREPPICMVGSGVSADSPACLPLAARIVGWVVSELRAPTVSDEELRAVCDDLPAERVFEAILMILEWLEIENAGDRITNPWSVLDTSCDNPRSAPMTTFGHLLVVYFASQRGCPVVTTNFDCLLENAARQLGLKCHVESEDPVESWKRTPDDPQQVIIWKPHGSITKPHTIRATIERTARLRPALIRVLEDLFRTGPTLVTGYSGRDLDVFPALRACPRTMWVTPERSFGDRLFEQFGGRWFKAKLNPVATEFANQLAASTAVAQELKRVGPLCGTVATQLRPR